MTIYTEDKDGHDIALIWTVSKNPALIAHEVVHAANFTLKDLNINSHKDDEFQCRLVEHLVEEALEK